MECRELSEKCRKGKRRSARLSGARDHLVGGAELSRVQNLPRRLGYWKGHGAGDWNVSEEWLGKDSVSAYEVRCSLSLQYLHGEDPGPSIRGCRRGAKPLQRSTSCFWFPLDSQALSHRWSGHWWATRQGRQDQGIRGIRALGPTRPASPFPKMWAPQALAPRPRPAFLSRPHILTSEDTSVILPLPGARTLPYLAL